MPNVTIIGKHESIDIDFGDLFSVAKTKKSKWRKDCFAAVFITDTNMVVVRTVYKQDFAFCAATSLVAGALPVDSVDNKTPSSNMELFEFISNHIN